MLQFSYEAKEPTGGLVRGTVEAYSQELAVEALNNRGLIILGLNPVKKNLLAFDLDLLINRPNTRDVVVFTRQLATIIAADIPLLEGLQTIANQSDKKTFSAVVNDVAEAIRGGDSLSKALASKPKLFSPFYISLVKSGEISGRLDSALIYLADYLEKSQALTAKIRSALSYPIFILFALGAVSIIMMTTVLPKLLDIVKESGVQDIPTITKVMVTVTDLFNRYFIFFFIGLAILVFLSWQYLKTEKGLYRWDWLKINVPRVGFIARNIYLARIAETLSTLIKAGVPILDGLKITSEIADNRIYRDILLEAEKNVSNGGTISEIAGRYKEFPKLATSMLAIGEKTGKTTFMLENIFKFYNFEAERDIQSISQLIEPVLLLLLGVGIGLLVAGILLPIFSLVGSS